VTHGADHKKKQRKLIQHIWACIGSTCQIEYKIFENNIEYTRKAELASGDIFFVDQKAFNFAYRVAAVRPDTKPHDLCVRDGTLLVNFAKN